MRRHIERDPGFTIQVVSMGRGSAAVGERARIAVSPLSEGDVILPRNDSALPKGSSWAFTGPVVNEITDVIKLQGGLAFPLECLKAQGQSLLVILFPSRYRVLPIIDVSSLQVPPLTPTLDGSNRDRGLRRRPSRLPDSQGYLRKWW